MREVMTVEEAARRLNTSPQTIRFRIRNNYYPFGKAFPTTTGAGWRYEIYREQFDAYIRGE